MKTQHRADARFEARPARYVRATFISHHPKQDGYDANFSFLAKLEAYTP